MHRSTVTLAALAFAAPMWLAMPVRGDAQQVWKTIKAQAEKKLEARKAKADSAAIARAGQTVDSTLAKTGRGVDTVVSKTASFADAVVDRTGRIVSGAAGALRGKGDDETWLAAELDAGRAVLAEIRFDGATDQLAAESARPLERLARLLAARPGTFLIEGHVEGGGDAAAEQALSERRAAAVKARLVAAGVPAERLFAMGLGATRPPADAKASGARIEVARMK